MTCESRLVPALRIAFYEWNYFSCFSQFTCCHEGIFRECVFKYKANYYSDDHITQHYLSIRCRTAQI